MLDTPEESPEFHSADLALKRLAHKLVFDLHEAEDVVQETWLAALQGAPADPEQKSRWMTRVTRNIAAGVHRRKRRRDAREEAAARLDRTPATGDEVALASVRSALEQAVNQLEEPYLSAIRLHFYEGLPPRELAKQLRVPVETARTRVKRGLAQLRARLDRRFAKDRLSLTLGLVALSYPELLEPGSSVTSSALSAPAQRVPRAGTPAHPPRGAQRVRLGPADWLVLGSVAALGTFFALRSGGADPVFGAAPAQHATSETSASAGALDGARRALEAPALDPVAAAPVAPAAALAGRVLLEDGSVPTRAFVRLYEGDTAPDPAALERALLEVRCDADGRFELAPLPASFFVEAFERASGAPAREGERICEEALCGEIVSHEAPAEIELRLVPSRRVEGRVLDPNGAGIAGASVASMARHAPAQHRSAGRLGLSYTPQLARAAVTDAEGHFAFEALPPGVCRLEVRSEGYFAQQWTLLEDQSLVELWLERPLSFSVRATDTQGNPVAGARVLLFGGGRERLWLEQTTDADGLAWLERLPASNLACLSVDLPENRSLAPWVAGPTPVFKFALQKRIECVLEPSRALAGRVVDAAGAPVAGALVSARDPNLVDPMAGEDRQLNLAVVRLALVGRVSTDAEGRFEFPGLPDRPLLFEARVDEKLLLTKAVERLPAGVLVLSAEDHADRVARVAGRVVGDDGKSVSQARLCLIEAQSNAMPLSVELDGAGRFDTALPASGNWSLCATALDHAPVLVPATAALGRDANGFELVLSPRRALDVELVDQDGQALAGVLVSFRDAAGLPVLAPLNRSHASSVTRTGPRGELCAPNMPARVLFIDVASADGEPLARAEVDLRHASVEGRTLIAESVAVRELDDLEWFESLEELAPRELLERGQARLLARDGLGRVVGSWRRRNGMGSLLWTPSLEAQWLEISWPLEPHLSYRRECLDSWWNDAAGFGCFVVERLALDASAVQLELSTGEQVLSSLALSTAPLQRR